MIRHFALICLFLFPSIGHAEDAAHREDRLRTEALNRQAKANSAWHVVGANTADQREAYRVARARYERQMDEWRDRVSACRSGHYEACDGN